MSDTSIRVEVKQAVTAAMEFVRDMYRGQGLRDVLLEEVELAQPGNQWLVTIGFLLARDESTSILTPATKRLARKYKIVAVDAISGRPISMKIREVK